MNISLTNRYIPAMIILALLAIANFFVNNYRFGILNKHGEIINKSGKQRMISQKSLLLTHLYLNHNQKDALNKLNDILLEMQKSNNFLTSSILTPKLKELYFKYGLKNDVNNFIKYLYHFIDNPNKMNSYPYTRVSKLLVKLNMAVKLHEEHYNQDLEYIRQIDRIILIGILSMLLLLVIFIFIPTKKAIETKIKEIKQQQEQLKLQDLDILAKSKNAQMGEMIGNIAHQWRQPLSAISSSATGLLLQKEIGILNNEEESKTLSMINNKAQFLSETINTFVNYIKEDKELKNIILQDNINNAVQIVKGVLKTSHIELINNINDIEPIELMMVAGELPQVIINLLNNAKDIMNQKNIEDKWIKIDLVKIDNKAIITIKDNGGGVPTDIIDKIFDPYFTTKHQSQGTGLGLHMSKVMIEKTFNGSLKVDNNDNGAVFKIILPLT